MSSVLVVNMNAQQAALAADLKLCNGGAVRWFKQYAVQTDNIVAHMDTNVMYPEGRAPNDQMEIRTVQIKLNLGMQSSVVYVTTQGRRTKRHRLRGNMKTIYKCFPKLKSCHLIEYLLS